MKLKLLMVAAAMLVGTTSALALVQKPAAVDEAQVPTEVLVQKLAASLPKASSMDRAP
jgi:hypothetical protein